MRLCERSRLGLSLSHISTNCTAPALPALQLVRRLPASLCSLSYMPTLGWALPTLLAGNKPRSSLRITLPGQPSLSHLGVQAMGTGLCSPIFFTITSRAYLFFFFFLSLVLFFGNLLFGYVIDKAQEVSQYGMVHPGIVTITFIGVCCKQVSSVNALQTSHRMAFPPMCTSACSSEVSFLQPCHFVFLFSLLLSNIPHLPNWPLMGPDLQSFYIYLCHSPGGL